MDVACPNCPAMYPISEQKLAGRLVRFRCKACGHAIVLDGRPNPTQAPPSSQAPGSASLRPVPQDSIPVSALYPSDSPAIPQPLSAAKTILQQAPAAPSALAGSRQSSGPPPAGPAANASFEPFAGTPGRAPANLRFTGSGPSDAELDPSVYEDETVAMTAHELESVADAKSQQSSAAPPAFRHQPPPKPQSSVPPAPPAMTDHGDPHRALSPGGPPETAHPGHALQQQPRRAESWSVGQPLNAGTPPPTPAPNLWQQPPPPVYAPLNDVTMAAGSGTAERRWVFPALLVLLGAGGLLLGGLLGKTWLARLWNDAPAPPHPVAVPSAVVSPTEGRTLPLFDARLADARLAQAAADAVHCLNADTAPLTGVVSARFLPSGKLETVNLTGTVADAAESPCIRSVFEKVEVAPFQGNPTQVERPIELRPRP